jgi:hypothetical protein
MERSEMMNEPEKTWDEMTRHEKEMFKLKLMLDGVFGPKPRPIIPKPKPMERANKLGLKVVGKE